MRITEILLPKNTKDRDLSPAKMREIGILQKRMDSYVDKILDPSTSARGREFLKSRLQSDYDDLKTLIPSIHHIVGDETPPTQEKPAKVEPQKNKVDWLSIARNGSRTGMRISEAIHKLPLTDADFELIKEIMENPIPAAVASIYIQEIIDDDEFNDQIKSLEDTQPNRDIRPLIVEWVKRVMPDQMHRFGGEKQSYASRKGLISPIHGYDPHMYKGSNDPITGNAYGRA